MATFQLVLLEDAKQFLQNIPKQAQKKVLYNIWRVTGGEKNKELFKKLENSNIWEFRTLYNGIAYRFVCFLGYRERNFGYSDSRHNQKNAKDPSQGDCKGRNNNETIF